VKYLPTNEAGEKPYTVVFSGWGQVRTYLVYAKDAAQARYRVLGRGGPGQYVKSVRRARAEGGR